jgi:hypothetical protein
MFSQDPLAVVGRVKAGILKHMGVLLPDGHVAHCAPGRGEHVSTLQEFAGGQERLRIVRHVPPERHRATIGRIVEALRAPKPYGTARDRQRCGRVGLSAPPLRYI